MTPGAATFGPCPVPADSFDKSKGETSKFANAANGKNVPLIFLIIRLSIRPLLQFGFPVPTKTF